MDAADIARNNIRHRLDARNIRHSTLEDDGVITRKGLYNFLSGNSDITLTKLESIATYLETSVIDLLLKKYYGD